MSSRAQQPPRVSFCSLGFSELLLPLHMESSDLRAGKLQEMKWGKKSSSHCQPAAGMCSASSFPACQSCKIGIFGGQAPSVPVCGVSLLSLLQLRLGESFRLPCEEVVALEGHLGV